MKINMIYKAKWARKTRMAIISLSFVVYHMTFSVACDNYLDELPDNRTEITTETKVKNLLTSAYLNSDPLYVAECSSDNMDCYVVSPYTNRFADQVYNWMDITESDNQSPEHFWEDCYIRIATANLALESIEKMGGATTQTLRECKGEALLCRAYAHFMLANVFAHAYNNETSEQDLGIVYMTRPAQTLAENPERLSVAEVYRLIDRDLQEALPLVGSNYDVPKYHFTPRAAYAFACRFYLYYEQWDKAIEYADKCLGTAPESMLRDWAYMETMTQDYDAITQHYIDASLNCNLLLLTSYSNIGIVFGPYTNMSRYSHGRYLAQHEDGEAVNIWGSARLYQEMKTYTGSQFDKTIFWKLPFLVEYVDVVRGTGYTRTVYPAFTADEVLLNRAEAYVLTEQYDKAAADLTLWMRNFVHTDLQLTPDMIQRFYNASNYSYSDEKGITSTIKKHLHPKFDIGADGDMKECMLQCVLGFRRIETLQTGMRWYDVKRYGMEIIRRTINAAGQPESVTDILKTNDPRRAIQIPLSARSAGVAANPR